MCPYVDMKGWIESRITKNTPIITNNESLVALLAKSPNVYCFCSNDKNKDDEATFLAVAKSLPFLSKHEITEIIASSTTKSSIKTWA